MTRDDIVNDVLRTKKYSNVDKAVVERISVETLPKYNKQKDVLRAVKKELHIIYESFLQGGCYSKAEAILNSYESAAHCITDKDCSVSLMALHTSTNERLGQVEEIYDFISQYVTTSSNVIDIGCGFNPFALPFFKQLPKEYFAFDISLSTIQVLNMYFKLAGLDYKAAICDAAIQTPGISGIPDSNTKVLFMFKLFPILERQKKGRAFEILKSINCEASIVSFPLKSVSGKEKGMETHYSSKFEKDLPTEYTIKEKAVFENEMFYVLEK
ncbi:MAG: Rmt family 16S rRNA (guanine(1405)-N(7))-methyltransferase [Oscillospiraceae bacterium]|jgi:16S rRNA (guanine(1405)-N(7))-methyltransferase|nr:Rmt family 16S rRNA (guanine(1405)-N(7))-methyltransferase [Oscillospiraceae bacterium]